MMNKLIYSKWKTLKEKAPLPVSIVGEAHSMPEVQKHSQIGCEHLESHRNIKRCL